MAGCGLQRTKQAFYARKRTLCVAGDDGVGKGNHLSSERAT